MNQQSGMHTDRGKYQMHYKTAQSETVAALVEGPKPAAELPTKNQKPPLGEYIDKLKVGNGGYSPDTIYYLYGDERRAARQFVARNPEYVAEDRAATGGGKLSVRLGDWMYRLIVEEWQLAGVDRP